MLPSRMDKSIVAVNSRRMFSLFDLNIRLTVVSHEINSSDSSTESFPFFVSTLIWCASSEIRAIFFSMKSSKVTEFSRGVFNLE